MKLNIRFDCKSRSSIENPVVAIAHRYVSILRFLRVALNTYKRHNAGGCVSVLRKVGRRPLLGDMRFGDLNVRTEFKKYFQHRAALHRYFLVVGRQGTIDLEEHVLAEIGHDPGAIAVRIEEGRLLARLEEASLMSDKLQNFSAHIGHTFRAKVCYGFVRNLL